MTPVALLAAFCATMAAIAVGRLALEGARDRVEIGSAVVVVGISLLAALWAALKEAWLTPAQRLLLGVVGTCVVCVGVAMMTRYWDDPPESNATGE